jgi:hypothetical protein
MKQTQCIFYITLLLSLVLATTGSAYQQSFESTAFTNSSPRAMLIVVCGISNTFELSNTEIMDHLISEGMYVDEIPSDILPKTMPGATPLLSSGIQEEPLLLSTLKDLPTVPYYQGTFSQVDADALAATQASVPEPSTLALLCLGLLGLLGIAKKRKLL